MKDEEKKQEFRLSGYYDMKFSWRKEGYAMRKFVEGLKDRKILGAKCGRCGKVYVPPAPVCWLCFDDIGENQIVQVSDTGKVVAYTIGYADVRGAKRDDIVIPVWVQFDGADSWIVGVLEGKGITPKEMEDKGYLLKVRVVWASETKGALSDIDHFEPI